MVAPIKVIFPFSTAPSSASCCDLLKRWISSIKTTGVSKSPLSAITSRNSFTPVFRADKLTNGRSIACAKSKAIVVLPTPGGPQKNRR